MSALYEVEVTLWLWLRKKTTRVFGNESEEDKER